jgi:hypothetical protein
VGRGRGAAIGAAVLGAVLLVSTGVAETRVTPATVASSNPTSFVSHNGQIYFIAKDGQGTRIWALDGTGSHLLVPLYSVASNARDLTWGTTKLYSIAAGSPSSPERPPGPSVSWMSIPGGATASLMEWFHWARWCCSRPTAARPLARSSGSRTGRADSTTRIRCSRTDRRANRRVGLIRGPRVKLGE